MPIIVIDPGDDGSGKVRNGRPSPPIESADFLSRDMSLDLAMQVKLALEGGNAARVAKEAGKSISVLLTRTGDVASPPAGRARIAKRSGANLFLGLHYNTFDRRTRGTEAWIDRKYARAYKVNQAGRIRTVSEGPGAPSDEIRNINHVEDAQFAAAMAHAAFEAINRWDKGARLRSTIYDAHHFGESYCPPAGVKMKGLSLLKDTSLGTTANNCRACLLMVDFVDHPAVATLFNGPQGDRFQQDLAEAIAKALVEAI